MAAVIAQPVSHTVPSGPEPAASSEEQIAKPGPRCTHVENSASHSEEQAAGGVAGGGGGASPIWQPGLQPPWLARGPVPAASSDSQIAWPGPNWMHRPNSRWHSAVHGTAGSALPSVHPGSQKEARGPVPCASSVSQVAWPGPNDTQLRNSAAHAAVHGDDGGGGAAANTQPCTQKLARGPVPCASSVSQPAWPGPKRMHSPNSLRQAAEQGAGGAGGGGGSKVGSAQPGVQPAVAKTPVAEARAASQSLPPEELLPPPEAGVPAAGGGDGEDGVAPLLGLSTCIAAVLVQPAVHSSPRRPAPESISQRQVAKPGPNWTQFPNSAAQASEHSDA